MYQNASYIWFGEKIYLVCVYGINVYFLMLLVKKIWKPLN